MRASVVVVLFIIVRALRFVAYDGYSRDRFASGVVYGVVNACFKFTEMCMMTSQGGIQCILKYPRTSSKAVKYTRTIYVTFLHTPS